MKKFSEKMTQKSSRHKFSDRISRIKAMKMILPLISPFLQQDLFATSTSPPLPVAEVEGPTE